VIWRRKALQELQPPGRGEREAVFAARRSFLRSGDVLRIPRPGLLRILPLTAFLMVSWTLARSVPGPARPLGGVLSAAAAVSELSADLVESCRSYFQVRDARLIGWLPGDEGLLITTRLGEHRQLHRVETAGGMRRQLSFLPDSVEEAEVAPSRGRAAVALVLEHDPGQLLLFDLRTTGSRVLDREDGRFTAPSFSHEGRHLLVTLESPADSTSRLLLLEPFAGSAPVTVLQGRGRWRTLDWAPDDDRVVVQREISPQESELWLVEIPTLESTRILEDLPPARLGPARFAGEGGSIVFLGDPWRGIREPARLDLDDGTLRRLAGQLRWDAEGLEVSPDGRIVAFSVDENGASRIYLSKLEGVERSRGVDLPTGVVGRMRFLPQPKTYRLALELTTPISPWDVYVIEGVDERPRRVRGTESEMAGIDPERLSRPSPIHYRTFDQGSSGGTREVSALYYRPLGAGPHAVVIDLGRGRRGQNRPAFDPRVQFWVTRLGLAVLAPNPRGSTGYGRDFTALGAGEGRADVVRDLLALLDWIEERPELDASRIGVFGEGAEADLALATLARSEGRLQAAAVLLGDPGEMPSPEAMASISEPLLFLLGPGAAGLEKTLRPLQAEIPGLGWFLVPAEEGAGGGRSRLEAEARLGAFWLSGLAEKTAP